MGNTVRVGRGAVFKREWRPRGETKGMETKGRDQENGDQGERPREWRPKGETKRMETKGNAKDAG